MIESVDPPMSSAHGLRCSILIKIQDTLKCCWAITQYSHLVTFSGMMLWSYLANINYSELAVIQNMNLIVSCVILYTIAIYHNL